jgi:hypothetical protein
MDINRTGPRNAHLENPAQQPEQNAVRFKNLATQTMDPDAGALPAGVPAGITRADLRDARKSEEILKRCFSDMVDNASREAGVPISDTQKRNLLEFLGNDPVMRGKLLNYLEQTVK